ncbi:DNA replication factor [Parasponia andersonii]|uniref:DNA replication factor n=1 Tax=Parasponia andersonii TaxID=3476 RepID=A0A2P5C9S2_PARAD|nr:DNA replication factor [Parasponia andersonii]
MNEKACVGAKQDVLDFKCKKIINSGFDSEKSTVPSAAYVNEPEMVDNKDFACQTPQKTNELSHNKLPVLPEKYNTLVEFYHSMCCSLKLLGLCKRLPTFENVSTQIRVLTKRNFLYRHLAQIKYILPEALQIEKILIHDKKTLSMKSDMKITLLFDIVEGHSEISDFIALSQVFSLRLYNFCTTHPEASDVPEAILPEPFTQRSQINVPSKLLSDCYVKSEPDLIETELLSEKDYPNTHFSRHFSQNAVVVENEETQNLVSIVLPPLNGLDKQVSKKEQQGESNYITSPDTNNGHGMPKQFPGTCCKSVSIYPQLQPDSPRSSVGISTAESPLVDLTSSEGTLMIETPSQSIPRRLVSSYDVSHKIMSSQRSTPGCKPTKRILNFFHVEGDESASSEESADKSKHDENVCHGNSHTSEGFSEDGDTLGFSAPPQERQVCDSMCQHMSSSLVDMIALIHSIFTSVNCFPITKEELVHKIIINDLDIVEKREVEEQIDLLERLVPDWIYKELAPSGDIMYNIKDLSDLDSIQAKLVTI